MEPGAEERVVKSGTFLYVGEVRCDVRIVYSPTRYGSGDHADAEEFANDQKMDSYYVEYGSTTQRNVFTSGGGWFPSLSEAVHHVEQAVQGITWND